MKLKAMKKLVLLVAFVGFVFSLNAQTANEAVEALKQAVTKSQAKDYLGAVEQFKLCVSIYDQLGETENENRKTAVEQITNMQYKHALGLYKEKKYDESIVAFQNLAEYSEKYNDQDNLKKANKVIPQLYYFKGKDLLDAKDYDAALEALNKSIELEFDYPNSHLRKAQLFEEKGDEVNFKAAIDDAIKASTAKKDSKSEDAAKTMAGNYYLKAGADAFKAEKYGDAEKYFNIYGEYKEMDSDIYYQLSATYNKLSKWDDAITAANKSLEILGDANGSNKDARIYFELGNDYYGKGDNTAACDAYSKAAKGDYEASAKYQMEQVIKCN